MKKLLKYLLILSIFTNTLNAFDKDTPEPIRLFCQMINVAEQVISQQENAENFQRFSSNEKLLIVRQQYAQNPQLIYWYERYLNELNGLYNQIINENLVLEVPYRFRECFPKDFQVKFQALNAIDNLENRILAIGGTQKEIEMLEFHGFEKNSFCSINVLPSCKPNYLADMTIEDHMQNFASKFKIAFARAVPCDSNSISTALNNISKSLSENGIFIANMQISSEKEVIINLLNQAGFLSFKIFEIDETHSVKFIASLANISADELEEIVNNDERMKTIKSYVFLEPGFEAQATRNIFSWCNLL